VRQAVIKVISGDRPVDAWGNSCEHSGIYVYSFIYLFIFTSSCVGLSRENMLF